MVSCSLAAAVALVLLSWTSPCIGWLARRGASWGFFDEDESLTIWLASCKRSIPKAINSIRSEYGAAPDVWWDDELATAASATAEKFLRATEDGLSCAATGVPLQATTVWECPVQHLAFGSTPGWDGEAKTCVAYATSTGIDHMASSRPGLVQIVWRSVRSVGCSIAKAPWSCYAVYCRFDVAATPDDPAALAANVMPKGTPVEQRDNPKPAARVDSQAWCDGIAKLGLCFEEGFVFKEAPFAKVCEASCRTTSSTAVASK